MTDPSEIDALADKVEAVRQRLLDRPQTVWLLVVTTKHGQSYEVFATEASAREEALRWMADYFDTENDGPELDAYNRIVNGAMSAGHDDDWVEIKGLSVRS